MKTIIDLSRVAGFCISFFFVLVSLHGQQGVAISTDGSSPDPSAMLHVISDTMGLLIPNLMLDDTATADPVTNPAVGLLIYNGGGTEPHGFYYWDGTKWQPLLAGKLAILSDADGDTRIEMDDGTDPDEISFVIDTNEVMRLDSATLHLEAPGGSLFIGKGAGSKDDGTDNRNTFIGINAGHSNINSYSNTVIGDSAAYNHKYGKANVFIGKNAGYGSDPEGGSAITAVGANALYNNNDNPNAIAIGNRAMYAAKHTEECTAVGVGALYYSHGTGNTAIGNNAQVYSTSGGWNSSLGYGSLLLNTVGRNNTVIGSNASRNNITGSSNSVLGYHALYSDTSGSHNVAIGDSSLYSMINQSGIVAIGSKAGASDTSGTSNTYIGHRSGYNALSGSENTYLGDSSGYHNATGSRNTYLGKQAGFGWEYGGDGDGNVAIGYKSLWQIKSGLENVAIGDSAGFNMKNSRNNILIGKKAGFGTIYYNPGERNIGIGTNSLYHSEGNDDNVAIGTEALFSSTYSQKNIGIGFRALSSLYDGGRNVAIGDNSMSEATGCFNNVSIGAETLIKNRGHSNSVVGNMAMKNNETGSDNTAIGESALYSNTSGRKNTAIGYYSLHSNTIGNLNTAIGSYAMQKDTSGSHNVALGDSSLFSMINQSGLVAIGSKAGALNALGERNTFIGYQSGYNTGQTVNNLPGNDNVFVGYLSGYTNDYGLQNTYLGKEAGYNSTGNNNIFLGHQAGMNEIGNGKLYIEPTNSSTPLLYGDFTSDYLTIHGKLGIGTKDPANQVHIHKDGSSWNYLRFTTTETGKTGNDGILLGLDPDENFRIHSYENTNIQYYIDNSLRMDMESTSGDVSMKLVADAGHNTGLKLLKNAAVGYGYEFEMYGTGSVDNLYLWTRKFGGIDSIRMTWQKDGKVGIGTTNPQEMLHVNGNAQFDGPFAVQPAFDLWLDADNKLSVSTSDARLKENVETLTGALDKVTKLRGVSYTWINSPETGTRHGLIAQEVREVIPDLVYKTKEYYGLNYSELSGFFVEAIKELSKENVRLIEMVNVKQIQIEALQQQYTKLQLTIDLIEDRFRQLESQIREK